MKKRNLGRGLVAGLLALALSATFAVRPRPAEATPITFDPGSAAISAMMALFRESGATKASIEAAKQQILNAIFNSTAEINAHLERLLIVEVQRCIDTATRELVVMDGYSPDSQTALAIQFSGCGDLANRQFDAVSIRRNKDSLGFLGNVIFPVGMAARAKAGIPGDQLLETYIGFDEKLVVQLRPGCTEGWSRDDTNLWVYSCEAVDGSTARGTRRWFNGQWLGPPIDKVAVEDYATRNTSRAVAQAALPKLRDALAKVRQSFVLTAVQQSRVTQWNTQGQQSWTLIGNPGTATAIASTLDVNRANQRQIVTIADGQVHHQIRNQDGSFTPFAWIGDHPGTATAVTTAVDNQGLTHVAAIVNGQVYHRGRYANGSWTPWALLGNHGTATALSSAVDAAGRFHLAVVIDGKVWHRIRYGDGGWSALGLLDHPGTATAVAVADDASGSYRIQLAAVIDGQVWHRIRLDESSWTDWGFVGNPGTATGLTAASDPSNDLQLTTVIGNRVYQRTRFQNGAWSSPPHQGDDPWLLIERYPLESAGTVAIAAS